MSNVIYLNNPNDCDYKRQDLQYNITLRVFSRALLLKLNAPKDGDIAAILEPESGRSDLECVMSWLTASVDHLTDLFDIDQYYEILCCELNERLSGH